MTRRELLALAGRLGAAAGATPWLAGRPALAQAPTTGPDFGKTDLIRHSVRPPDYETPVALLDAPITPLRHFYARCHLPVPTTLDAASWRLQVDGGVDTPLALTVADLRAMPPVSLTMTLECAGNGRAFFDPPVAGIQWRKGAVGTARWTGVPLEALLRRAGVKPGAAFVHVEAADRPLGTMPAFVRQVPLDKARRDGTLVAYEMNGEPIPAIHGFPLRLIVPGWEGAYSVKWLTRLHVADRASENFWVATAYRYPTRRVAPGAAVPPAEMAPLTGLAVKSLITAPLDGTNLPRGPISVGGFAWTGEADIARVDVSVDHGATWHQAELAGDASRYAWRRFTYRFEPPAAGSYLILARATDSTGAVQPAVSHWNPSGYLWNQYDSVRIEVA